MSSTPIMVNRLSVPSSILTVGPGPLDAPARRNRTRSLALPSSLNEMTNQNTEESDLEIKRRKSALYSRRSLKRRELTLISLQDQKRLLEQRNQALRRDNARLEYMLGLAHQAVALSNLNHGSFMQAGKEPSETTLFSLS